MKRIIITTITLFTLSFIISAQMVHSTYFLDGWSKRSKLNPAFVPQRTYVAIPMLGEYKFGVHSNMGLSSFIYPNPSDTGYMLGLNNQINDEVFLKTFNDNNGLWQDLNVGIISLGFFENDNNNFWSLDVSLQENMSMNIPKDFFRLLKSGMTTSNNNIFDLKNLGFAAEAYLQTTIGHSRQLNDDIRIGANIKIINGIGKTKLNYSKFDLQLSEDLYRLETEGEFLYTDNLMSFQKDGEGYLDFSKNELNPSFGLAGFGLAIDLGATYQMLPNLSLAASLNNIGFINWGKNKMINSKSQGSWQFDGLDIIDAAIDSTLVDEFSQMLKFKEVNEKSGLSQSTPIDFKLSAEYSIFGNKNKDILVGLLYHHFNSNLYDINELVLAVNFVPASWAKVSTTVDLFNSNFNKFGLGISIPQRDVNFFLASDFIFPKVNPQNIPVEKLRLNFALGMAVSFGKSKY